MTDEQLDGMFSSATDEWATPQEFFDELNSEFHFTLDPAANEENHKCETFFTKEQNGLTCQWGGHTVFCNPPYGREIGKWVQKAWEEHKKNGNTVVMLLPARTDTQWFHKYIYGKAEIRFVRGRLKFGGAAWNAPFPSMVVIFRRKCGFIWKWRNKHGL
nr:MAG TPA: DNA N-6-adenine-methyltransferase [Caudoviricetes sp.]